MAKNNLWPSSTCWLGSVPTINLQSLHIPVSKRYWALSFTSFLVVCQSQAGGGAVTWRKVNTQKNYDKLNGNAHLVRLHCVGLLNCCCKTHCNPFLGLFTFLYSVYIIRAQFYTYTSYTTQQTWRNCTRTWTSSELQDSGGYCAIVQGLFGTLCHNRFKKNRCLFQLFRGIMRQMN